MDAELLHHVIADLSRGLTMPHIAASPERRRRVLDGLDAASAMLADLDGHQPPPAPVPSHAGVLVELVGFRCERCTHEWRPRLQAPKVCPRCKSPYWNRPRRQRVGG